MLEEDEDQYNMNETFLRLFNSYVETGKLPPVIDIYTNEFVLKLIPDVIYKLVSRIDISPEDVTEFIHFITEIALLLSQGLSKDREHLDAPFQLLLNLDNPIFRDYTTTGISSLCNRFGFQFMKKKGLNPIIERLQITDPPPTLDHLYTFFLCLSFFQAYISQIDFQKILNNAKIPVINFIHNIDNTQLRAANSQSLAFILKSVVHHSRIANQLEETFFEILDFSLRCIKCDFLDKKICSAKVLTFMVPVMIIDHYDMLKQWLEESKIIEVIVNTNLHENVIEQLTDVFSKMISVQDLSIDTFMQIWKSMKNVHILQKVALRDLLIKAITASSPVVASEFVNSLINEKPSLELLQFLQKLSCHLTGHYQFISKDISQYILALLDNPEYSDVAFEAVQDLVLESRSHSTVSYFLEYCIKKLSEENVSKSVCSLMHCLISSIVHHNHDFDDSLLDTLLECLNKRNDKEPILDLISLCLVSTQHVISCKQLKSLWESIYSNVFTFLKSLLQVRKLNWLDNEGIAFIDQQLISLDYKKVDVNFAEFLKLFIITLGEMFKKILLTTTTFSVYTMDLPGFTYLVRAISDAESEETVKTLIEFTLSLCRQIHNLALKDSMLFIVSSFLPFIKEEALSPAKYRTIVLFTKIISKLESIIGLEDYGLKRHKIRNPRKMIEIKIETPLDELVELEVPADCTVEYLCTKFAFKQRLNPASVYLCLGKRVMNKRYNISYYKLNSEAVVKLKKKQNSCDYSIEMLLSYNLAKNGVANILFNTLRNQKADEKILSATWNLITLLPTDDKIKTIDLVELIKSATNEYVIKYAITSALKLKMLQSPELGSLVLEFVLQGRIKKLALAASFDLLLETKIDELKLHVNELITILLKNLSTALSDHLIGSACSLLCYISSLDPAQTQSIFIEETSQFSQSITQLPPKAVFKMIPLFQSFPDRKIVFDFLIKFIDQMTDNPHPYFKLISSVIPNNYDSDEPIKKVVTLIDKSDYAQYYGLCEFIASFLLKCPNAITDYQPLINIFVPRVILEDNEKMQGIIVSILKSIIYISFDNQKEVVVQLIPALSKPIKVWNYLPSKNLKTGTQMTGLQNKGALCYMNSVLQQLYANSTFRRMIIEGEDTQLKDLFTQMHFTKLPYLTTTSFVETFRMNGREIFTWEQQDAVEFFQALFDSLPKSVSSLYLGKFVNIIEGIDEHYESKNTEDFFVICLAVKNFNSFEQSFTESFMAEQLFTGDNQYLSDKSNKKIDAKKYTRIQECPNYLVIQLKRFEYDIETMQRYKVHDHFDFPTTFDIAPYTIDPENHINYKLVGVVVHNGTADSGHYYSLIDIEGQYYCFDDNRIYLFPQEYFDNEVFGGSKQSGYLLFYKKEEISSPYVIEEELLISDRLRKVIDDQNKNYIYLQSVFTYTFFEFICNFTHQDVLLPYFINVFMHSRFEDQSCQITQHILSHISDPDNALKFIKSKYDKVMEIIEIKKESDIQTKDLILIINEILSKASEESAEAFLNRVIYDITNSIIYPQILEYFGDILYNFVINQGTEIAVKQDWVNHLTELILMVLKSEKAVDLCQKLDFRYVLKTLLLLKSHMTQKQLNRLQKISPRFISFTEQGSKLVKIFFGDESFHKFMMQTFTPKHVSLYFGAVLDSVKTEKELNQALEMLDLDDIEIMFTLFHQGIVKPVQKFPHILVFPFLISEEEEVRKYAETISLNTFRFVAPLPPSMNAESLLDDSKDFSSDISMLYDDDDRTQSVIIDEKDVPAFNHFIEQICKFIDHIRDYTGLNRFAALGRIARWLIKRSPDTSAEIITSLWKLLKRIGHRDADGSIFEIVVAIHSGYIEDINEIVDPIEFAKLIFPLDFHNYKDYSMQLFSISFSTVSQSVEVFLKVLDLKDFVDSFIQYTICTSDESYMIVTNFLQLFHDHELIGELSQKLLDIITIDFNENFMKNQLTFTMLVMFLRCMIPEEIFSKAFHVFLPITSTEIDLADDIKESLILACASHVQEQENFDKYTDEIMKYAVYFLKMYSVAENPEINRATQVLLENICEASPFTDIMLLHIIDQLNISSKRINTCFITLELKLLGYCENESKADEYMLNLLSILEDELCNLDEECIDEIAGELNILILKKPFSNIRSQIMMLLDYTINIHWPLNMKAFVGVIMKDATEEDFLKRIETINRAKEMIDIENFVTKIVVYMTARPDMKDSILEKLNFQAQEIETWPEPLYQFIEYFIRD